MKMKILTAVIAALGVSFALPAMAHKTHHATSENAESWMRADHGPRDQWPTYDTDVKNYKKTNEEVAVGEPSDPNHPIHNQRMGDH